MVMSFMIAISSEELREAKSGSGGREGSTVFTSQPPSALIVELFQTISNLDAKEQFSASILHTTLTSASPPKPILLGYFEFPPWLVGSTSSERREISRAKGDRV